MVAIRFSKYNALRFSNLIFFHCWLNVCLTVTKIKKMQTDDILTGYPLGLYHYFVVVK